MLKNLIKYEWKAIWRVLLIINSFTMLTTLIGLAAMHALDGAYGRSINVICSLIFILYYVTIIGVSFAMSIYVGIRFYKNLYTDEGYLMHTLPVTKRQLVISKLLVHSFCLLITEIIVLVSIAVLLFPLLAILLGEPDLFLTSLLRDMKEMMQTTGLSVTAMVVSGTVSAVIGMFSGVLSIYWAITLGQTFRGHKVMGAILCYIGLYCLMQSVSSVFLMPQMSLLGVSDFNPMVYVMHAITTTSIISMFFGIICYCITLYMMNHKLNLD